MLVQICIINLRERMCSLPCETTMKSAFESNQCIKTLETIRGTLSLYGN